MNDKGFEVGQLVLIHQSKGTKNLGKHEVNRIKSVSNNKLDFMAPLKNDYLTSGTNAAQVLVLKQYSSVKVEAGKIFNAKNSKKTKPGIIIFTQEEIEKMLNTSLPYGRLYGKDCSFLDFRYRTLTMFLALTGCRFGEARDLKIKRLDLSAGRAAFVNTKTNENRSVYFAEPLISNLKKLIENKNPDDHVFRNSQEKAVQATDYSQDLKKRAIKAGVIKRTFPHNFRHSYATHMLEAGVPITDVATLLGHNNLQQLYAPHR